MNDLYQKKYYSNKETDEAIKRYAEKNGLGYSEAIRDIIRRYFDATVSIPRESYAEYLNSPLAPRD